jgi:flagellin
MSSIRDQTVGQRIIRNLEKAKSAYSDSLEKLSSGTVFTRLDPRPSERALAEKLEYRIRSLSASKSNINDAFSLLQTAESGLEEVNNMMARMKEITIAAANSTVTNQERYYLMIEYQGLFNEINRVAVTTEYNGMPLLNPQDPKLPKDIILRVDDPLTPDSPVAQEIATNDDVNAILLPLHGVGATAEALGVKTAREMIEAATPEEGIAIDDVESLLMPEESDGDFVTSFDQAFNKLAMQRHSFGAIQSRLQRSLDHIDVFSENIAAAKSRVADTDYTQEVTRMTESKILMNASTSLLAHANIDQAMISSLLNSVL